MNKVEGDNSRDTNPHTKQMASTLYDVHDCTEKEIRTKQCERWQALSILRRHEAWRHGYDGKTHPSAKELTWAMQYIIRELKKHFKEHICINNEYVKDNERQIELYVEGIEEPYDTIIERHYSNCKHHTTTDENLERHTY